VRTSAFLKALYKFSITVIITTRIAHNNLADELCDDVDLKGLRSTNRICLK